MFRIETDQHYAPLTLRFGALVADARGSVGGAVISRNAGGAYMRTRTTPTNPNTPIPATLRNLLLSIMPLYGCHH